MTSRRGYWRDIAIDSAVMTLCFEQLKNDIKIGLFIENKGVLDIFFDQPDIRNVNFIIIQLWQNPV